MHVENYVESMLKFQHVLKISNHVENYVKYVYVNHVENQVENCEVWKKPLTFHFLAKIFLFGTYFKLWNIRNYVQKQSRIFEK